MPARLINIKYITIRAEKVASPATALQGGQLISLKGPVILKTTICDVVLEHPFYFYDNNPTLLMGFDLITAAGLTIDTCNKCVWSEFATASPFIDSPLSCDVPSLTNDNDVEPPESVVPARSPPRSSAALIMPSSRSTSGPRIELPAHAPSTTTSATAVTIDGHRSSGPCAGFCVPSAARSRPRPARSGRIYCRLFTRSSVKRKNVKRDAAQLSASCVKSKDEENDHAPAVVENDETLVKVIDDDDVGSMNHSAVDVDLPEHVNVLFVQTLEEASLASDVARDLKELLHDHKDTFATSSSDLGFCGLLQHDIDTGDAAPIRQSPRTPPLSAREAEDQILDEMLESGVIEESRSAWASPVCLVRKKDGTFRFCVDYRRLNAVAKKDAYPVPDIQDALDHLRGAKYFVTMDLLLADRPD